jgi:ribonuclease D
VLAAAKKDDQVKHEEQARQHEEERRLRELALRPDHMAERRDKALGEVLEENAMVTVSRR